MSLLSRTGILSDILATKGKKQTDGVLVGSAGIGVSNGVTYGRKEGVNYRVVIRRVNHG